MGIFFLYKKKSNALARFLLLISGKIFHSVFIEILRKLNEDQVIPI